MGNQLRGKPFLGNQSRGKPFLGNQSRSYLLWVALVALVNAPTLQAQDPSTKQQATTSLGAKTQAPSKPASSGSMLFSADLQQRAQKSCKALLLHRVDQMRRWVSYSVPGHKGLERWRYMNQRHKILRARPPAPKKQKLVKQQGGNSLKTQAQQGAAQADAFAEHLWQSHDNTEQAPKGQLAALKGFSWRRSVLNDRRASSNGNVFVPTYFKQHDGKQTKIWLAVQHLWSRAKTLNEAQKIENTKAIESVRKWLAIYLRYRDDINEAIRRGFQARLQAEALEEYKKQLYVEDFSQTEGFQLDLPFLSYDGQRSTWTLKPVVFRDRMQIYGLQKRYYEQWRAQFGLPRPPLKTLKGEALYYTEGLLAGLLSPLRLLLHLLKAIPLSLRATTGFINNVRLGLWAYVHEGGKIYKHLRSQAFYYQRLSIVEGLLKARVDMREVPLNSQEKKLLHDIEQALKTPALAPRSDAVRYLQGQLYKSETVLFFSDKLRRGRALDFDQSDDFSYLQEEKKISTLKQVVLWAKRHKFIAFLGTSLTLSLAAGSEQLLHRASFLVRDNPRIGYYISSTKHNFHVFLDQLLGKNITSRLELKSPQASHNFGFERITLINILDEFFAFVREQRRIDPNYNYLTDPEYHKKLDQALEKALTLRDEYSTAAQLAHAQHRLEHIIIPRHILNLMHHDYKKHYPHEQAALDRVFDALTQATPLGQSENMQHLVQQHQDQLSPQLYRNLMYFARFGYNRAFVHYYENEFGALISIQGHPYESFGREPQPQAAP